MRAGFQEIDNGRETDFYVINTCTVTHRADAESFNLMRRAKRENPKAKIIVTGCLTELDEDKIKKIDNEALIVKNKDKNRILEILESRDSQLITHKSQVITFFKGHSRAFLKIQDGCNNFCSYCKVPLVRGALKSKPINTIIPEANKLVKNGFKEIVLCGICLGSYGKDLQHRVNVVDAIEALEGIEGLMRIRLSSIEANDVSDILIEKMAHSKKLCRHLHIPIQSGDNEILKKMGRKCSRQDYLSLIQKIKSRLPEIAITTDVLVGFPGEEEVNFKNTLDLIKEISPLKVHIFPYSPRQGTPAYNFKDRISPVPIRERILRLENIAKTYSFTYKKQFLNKDMDVLIEGHAKENKEYWAGYTDNYIKVLVKSDQNLKSHLVQVRLKKINEDVSYGDLYL